MKTEPRKLPQPLSYGTITQPQTTEDESRNSTPSIAPFTPVQVYDLIALPPDSQCIRVLDLPAKSSSNERLIGTLRRVNQQDCPKFTALSYVWGSSTERETISCNGCELLIRKSCYEALLLLQDLHGAITIWVDAVCIDQTNDNEKVTQIPLMGEIYTRAQAVSIWLGTGSKAIDGAIEYLLGVSKFRVFPAGIPWHNGNGPVTMFDDQVRFGKKICSIQGNPSKN
ncbi:Fc.00g092690.m01.CDS01 [Cosmosporella sp. VM-42]